MIGRNLAHYSIRSKIGQGGMGEVYRAHDTRLDRDVALKILPEIFVNDPQRMGRFSREARVLASLNHTHIAAIYGLEESEGKKALVMELVEGEDLSTAISRGQMPLEQALQIALQIAQALESAHEKGIIHRDLKPANIKLTPDAQVKVLDFGLAKALEGDPQTHSPELSHSPTLSLAATQAGIILGTAGYMSPEQARGQAVDRRTDIWAFGVILFEMLSGAVAFTGETLSDVLASVLKQDLDWRKLPEDTPRPVLKLLKRCLSGDPRQRFHDIADVRIEIEELLATPGSQLLEPTAAPSALGTSRRWVAALPAAALLFIAVGWFLKPVPEPPRPPSPVQLEAAVPGDLGLFIDQGGGAVLSPDGKRLAYVTGTVTESTRRLNLRSLNRLESTALVDTNGAYNPFFSPDGQWIGFVTPSELKKVSVSGGTPLTLCGVNLSRGAAWGETGTIVFARDPSGGLVKVSAAGGATEEVTRLENDEVSHRWPQFLPGSRQVLFSSYTSNDRNAGRIEVVDLETGQRKLIHQGGTYARYAASGHLLYVNNGTLFAAPFDLETLEMKALASPVLQGITANPEGGSQYDVSRDGTLVYLTGAVEGARRQLTWVSPEGRLDAVTETLRDYGNPRLSPDGRKVALEIIVDRNLDLWIHDLERDTQTRLTFDESIDQAPAWSADGTSLYFSSNRDGKLGIFRKRADGSGPAERLTESNNPQFPYSVSPDGKHLGYHEQTATGFDTWILPLVDKGEPFPLFESSFDEGDPVFSPDGRWVAYESNESGRWEVYIRPFPGPGGKWQVSTEGGEYARWSGDGRTLFFLKGSTAWKVPVNIRGDSLEIGRPEKLFDLQGTFQADWDVRRDGTRAIVVRDDQEGRAGGLNLLKFTFHWFQEVEQLLSSE